MKTTNSMFALQTVLFLTDQLSDQAASMPSYKPPYKRCKSGSHRHTSSKRTGSTSSIRSTTGSSRTGTSRRSSGSALQGQGHRRSSRDTSERPPSSLDTRTHIRHGTVDADDTSQIAREEPPDVELLSEVIMAVSLTDRGAIGCAYYVAQTETLYFMEDVQMGDAEMVDSCKQACSRDWRLNDADGMQ
jgi:DNA mismatch repair protein MSH5